MKLALVNAVRVSTESQPSIRFNHGVTMSVGQVGRDAGSADRLASDPPQKCLLATRRLAGRADGASTEAKTSEALRTRLSAATG